MATTRVRLPITGEHHGYPGKRWYDPNRMILSLFGIVGFFIVGWGSWVFLMARSGEVKNVEQDQRIQVLERSFLRVDDKLDRILEKQGK